MSLLQKKYLSTLKILIYTTHRTGSTALAELLMVHFQCDYHRGSLLQPPPTDIIIKLTPDEAKYEEIRGYFDKCIVLIRQNIKDQAESRVYADLVQKNFGPYSIDQQFLVENGEKIEQMSTKIKTENDHMVGLTDCLHVTYEDLFYSENGLKNIESYLKTRFNFKVDGSRKYRGVKKSLI